MIELQELDAGVEQTTWFMRIIWSGSILGVPVYENMAHAVA